MPQVMGFISGFGDSRSNLIQKVWHSVMFGRTTALTESLMGIQRVLLSPSQVSRFYIDQRTLLSHYLATRCIPTPRPQGLQSLPPWYHTQVPILISEICLYLCSSAAPSPFHKASNAFLVILPARKSRSGRLAKCFSSERLLRETE